MREFPARELLLRLALLRCHDGNPRALRRALAVSPSLVTAVANVHRLPPEVREVLAPLCVDDATLRARVLADIHLLSLDDASAIAADAESFPPLLAEIAEPPPLLFCRGDTAVLSRPQVAIVGSRHASPAGLALARAFAADLAAAGFVITSGLALGVDAMAHEGALAAGGQTVAVLGCGVDQVYPRRHAALAGRVRARGCVVSEFPAGTPPLAPHFPQRNRVISGLALGVLVVEAAPDSGSLITARFAAEQGREVFAIPGSIHSPLARGCHQLIREGATLVETSAQLVEALSHFSCPSGRVPPVEARAPMAAALSFPVLSPADLSPAEHRLLAALSPAGSGIDELVLQAGLPVSTVNVMLAELALRGRVHALAGGRWMPAH